MSNHKSPKLDENKNQNYPTIDIITAEKKQPSPL